MLAIYFQPPKMTSTGPQERSGHVAIVRQSGKPADLIAAEGPDVIQAGGTNYRSAPLKLGCKSHPAAWLEGKVEFFLHHSKFETEP